MDLLVKWKGYEEIKWDPVEVIKVDKPVKISKYVEGKVSLKQ